MTITLEQHLRYLTTRIDYETEFPKICGWMDKRWRDLYLPWLEDKSENKLTEDELCWKWLVTMFRDLSDGKKTKVFVYQVLVLNDIVNDGLNNKQHCPKRLRGCPIERRWLKKLGREWQDTDIQNICGNLAICLRLPDPSCPFLLDFSDDLTELVIDDRILNVRR